MVQRRAFHFTHLDNLERIVASGEIACDSIVSVEGLLAIETADPNLKGRRREVAVPCGPGGVLADYVPFYFAPRSPMLLRVATGRVPDYSAGQDPLVFLVGDVDALVASRHAVMTDGHPVSPITKFTANAADLDGLVDWPLMQAQMWNDTDEDGDRMRRRQAELLVHQRVAVTDLLGLGCRVAATAERVAGLLSRARIEIPVLVRPHFYYEGKP
ncbi:MAG: hypothetical protein JWO62_2040 [Acidimicrobiaceae bacterium]|nr:hypothetical protein [Acidimicrobiaceae bacterium]